MADINRHYEALLNEHGKDKDFITSYSTQKLEVKILQHYKNQLTIQKGKTRRGNLMFSKEISIEEALRKEHSMKTKFHTKLCDVAFALRQIIFDADYTPLPAVRLFFTHLIGGSDDRTCSSNSKQRRIQSISEDVIFATTSGRKKPSKHLKVGLAIKSITGSKKFIEVMNRLGHSASYSTIQELETELTFHATKEAVNSPEMKLNKNRRRF